MLCHSIFSPILFTAYLRLQHTVRSIYWVGLCFSGGMDDVHFWNAINRTDREQTRELALTEGFSASFSLRVRPSLHMHIAQTFGRGRNRSRRSPHFGYRKLVLPFSHFRETCEKKKKVDFRREPCIGGERRRHKD